MSRAEGAAGPGPVHLTILAWVSMLASDLVIHAGILHRHYLVPDPFLLPPPEAFRRIPLGYASFLVVAAFLVWLLDRLDVRGWRTGALTSLVVGMVLWGSMALGLASITTAPPILLAGWAVGQPLEMAVAGAVVGAGRAGMGSRGLWARVGAWGLFALVFVVVVQNLPG